jgi:VanZ family protein
MGNGLRMSVRWRVYLYGLPAMAWGAFLMAAALAPSLGPIEDIDVMPHQDKLFHFVEYLVLAMLTALALVRGTRRSREWVLRTTLIAVAAYGVLLEVLQVLVPERDFSLADLAFNLLGALVGTLGGMALLDLASPERAGQP